MNKDGENAITCGCYVFLFIVMAIVGGIASNYLLGVFFAKSIPFFWDMVIGAAIGEILIPIALVIWILKMFNVI